VQAQRQAGAARRQPTPGPRPPRVTGRKAASDADLHDTGGGVNRTHNRSNADRPRSQRSEAPQDAHRLCVTMESSVGWSGVDSQYWRREISNGHGRFLYRAERSETKCNSLGLLRSRRL